MFVDELSGCGFESSCSHLSNKTLTESINNLLIAITTTNKTLLDNRTRERIILNDKSDNINKEVEKRKRLHYQIYRSQQLFSYNNTLIRQEKLYVPTKFRQKVNESTPNYEKELKPQQSINAVKDEKNIVKERQKHWLIKLGDYDKNFQQFVETLSLTNNDKESMITKYRKKVKEDETRNLNNRNKHFDKLSLLNCVPCVLKTCSCANVPYVLRCQPALRA